jgi:hypothetical protein
MRNSLRRGLTLTALAGACTIALAPAALAQPTTSPEAFGIGASGLANLANTPDQTTIGTTSALSATVPGIVAASTLTATVNGVNSTSASVANLSTASLLLPLLSTISASAITTSCTANPDGTFTGTTTIASLAILGGSYSGTTTTEVPLAVTSPGGGIVDLSVIVNQMSAGPVLGSEQVNGLAISFRLGTLTETIDIADATCGPYSSGVPLASGKGMAIGLSVVGLAGAGLGTVYVRRRHGLAIAD